MKLSQTVKPVSYLKAHASEAIRNLEETGGTLVITRNGEAKVVVQDIQSFEQTQETILLLRRLLESKEQFRKGESHSLDDAFAIARERLKNYNAQKVRRPA
jgi:prevent-host-death family protein